MSIFNVGPSNPVPDGTKAMFDAAVRWTNNKYYFFKGSQWASYDITTRRVDPGFPRDISQGFPEVAARFGSVDSATILTEGTVVSPLYALCFFFKGNQSIVYTATGDYGEFVAGPIAANTATSTEFSDLAPRNLPSKAVQILDDDCVDDDSAFYVWQKLNPAWAQDASGPFSCAEVFPSMCYGEGDYYATVRRLCPATCTRNGYNNSKGRLCPSTDKLDHSSCSTYQQWLPSTFSARACENPFINRMCPVTCAGKAVPVNWCAPEGAFASCVASFNAQKSPFPAACPTGWYALGQLGFWSCPSVITRLLGNVNATNTSAYTSGNDVATRLVDESTGSFFLHNNQEFALAFYTRTGSSRFIISQYALSEGGQSFDALKLQGRVFNDGKLVSDAVQSHIAAAASIPTGTLANSYFAFAETTMWPVKLTSAGSPVVLGHNLVSNTELASVLFSQFGFSAKAGVVYDWSTNWPRIIDVFPGLEAFCEPRGNFIAYALQVCMGDVCKDTNGLSRAFVLSFTSRTTDTQLVQINLFRSNGALIYTTTTSVGVEVGGTVTVRLKDETPQCDDLVTEAKGTIVLNVADAEKSPAERNYRFQRVEKKVAQFFYNNPEV